MLLLGREETPGEWKWIEHVCYKFRNCYAICYMAWGIMDPARTTMMISGGSHSRSPVDDCRAHVHPHHKCQDPQDTGFLAVPFSHSVCWSRLYISTEEKCELFIQLWKMSWHSSFRDVDNYVESLKHIFTKRFFLVLLSCKFLYQLSTKKIIRNIFSVLLYLAVIYYPIFSVFTNTSQLHIDLKTVRTAPGCYSTWVLPDFYVFWAHLVPLSEPTKNWTQQVIAGPT